MNRNSREKAWEFAREELTRLSASSEAPIDPGIEELIVGLRVHGIPTETSCSGHLPHTQPSIERDWGVLPTIGINICPPASILTDTTREEHELHRKQFLLAEERLHCLLDEFYSKRDIPFEQRLHIGVYKNNKWGQFYLESYGAQDAIEQSIDDDVFPQVLERYLREMQGFGRFLRDRFLSESK